VDGSARTNRFLLFDLSHERVELFHQMIELCAAKETGELDIILSDQCIRGTNGSRRRSSSSRNSARGRSSRSQGLLEFVSSSPSSSVERMGRGGREYRRGWGMLLLELTLTVTVVWEWSGVIARREDSVRIL
jgi:hypothetical protein